MLESVDNNELFERDNPFSHFWGSCNKCLDERAAFEKSISIRTPAYTHQGNNIPLIDSLHEECRYFFRSCSPFLIWPFHAGDDEVLPISPTGTYLHHCFGILRDTNIPSWKQWLWICRLNRKAGKRTSILNVRANNFSMSFVWYSSHALFSSADIIIYQAEALQTHCTTTYSNSSIRNHITT